MPNNFGNNEYNGNKTNSFIFFFLVFIFALGIFYSLLPLFENFFKESLNASVHNHPEQITQIKNNEKHYIKPPNYINLWYIDVHQNTENEIRYIFNPLLSVTLPSLVISVFLTLLITSLLPSKIGYVRAKIDREIQIQLARIKNYRENEFEDIERIINDLTIEKTTHSTTEWGVNAEDLLVIQRAIRWTKMNLFQRILHFNDGLSIYMRFHFTYIYSNTVLGFVYIGAAVLIIIVGLRGLKFIPVTQPSLVLFALGLEFALLVTYAFTIMYARQEDEHELPEKHDSYPTLSNSEYGNHKEIEKLIRAFINKDNK